MVESKALFAWRAAWFLNLFRISYLHYIYSVFRYFGGTSQDFLSWGLGPERKGIRRTAYGSKREASSWSGSRRRGNVRYVEQNACEWMNSDFSPTTCFPVVCCWCWDCCVLSSTSKGIRPSSLQARGYADLRSWVRSRNARTWQHLWISQVVKLSGLTSHMISHAFTCSLHLPKFFGFSGLLRSHGVCSVISVTRSTCQNELDLIYWICSMPFSKSLKG